LTGRREFLHAREPVGGGPRRLTLRRAARPGTYFNEEFLLFITPFGVIMTMDPLTGVLSAIAHPTRRAIIGRLADGPARFLDIAEPFDVALNAITKHLKLLERAGLIAREKRGREVLISLRPQSLRVVADWVHPYERFWNAKLDEFAGHFRQQQRSKKR
jgi:DNA-binding transcriptional ArsR family regulator